MGILKYVREENYKNRRRFTFLSLPIVLFIIYVMNIQKIIFIKIISLLIATILFLTIVYIMLNFQKWKGITLHKLNTTIKLILIFYIVLSEITFISKLDNNINSNQIYLAYIVCYVFVILYYYDKNDMSSSLRKMIRKSSFLNHYVVIIVYFQGIIIVIYLLKYLYNKLNAVLFLIVYLLLLLFFILVELCVLIKFSPSQNNKKIDIKFLNLDNDEVLSHNIYYDSVFDGKIKYIRLFKLDMRELIQNNEIIENIYVLNHTCIQHKTTHSGPYIYYCMRKFEGQKTSKLIIKIDYRKNNIRKCKKAIIYLDFEELDGEVVPVNTLVSNMYQIRIFKNFKKELIVDTKDSIYVGNYFIDAYKYEYDHLDDVKALLEKNDLRDPRKWVYHNGPYGEGKTTLDVLWSSSSGRHSIIISPWEENYDRDLLYLIYDKTRRASKIKFSIPDHSTMLITLIALSATTAFLYSFIFFVGKKTMVALSMEPILSSFLHIIIKWKSLVDIGIGGISIILAFMFTSKYLPTIIIHMKDSTKIHQTFYVKEIIRRIKRENLILIIEDVDRLGNKAIKDVFRIISCLNHAGRNIHKVMGIVTFSEEKVKDKKIDDIIDLKEKVVFDTIFKNYIAKKSMDKYIQAYLNQIYKDSVFDSDTVQQQAQKIIEKCEKFRNIHALFEKGIKENVRTPSEMERLLNESDWT